MRGRRRRGFSRGRRVFGGRRRSFGRRRRGGIQRIGYRM